MVTGIGGLPDRSDDIGITFSIFPDAERASAVTGDFRLCHHLLHGADAAHQLIQIVRIAQIFGSIRG